MRRARTLPLPHVKPRLEAALGSLGLGACALGLYFGAVSAIALESDSVQAKPGASSSQNQVLHKQRVRFRELERKLRRRSGAGTLSSHQWLESYPLWPYLVYRDLYARWATVTDDEIVRFLRTHAKTPLATAIRRRWLKRLYAKKAWHTLTAVYEADPTRLGESTTSQCRYLTALLRTEQADLAFEHTRDLWLSPRSQPAVCDPVFEHWRQAGKLNPDLAWARIVLAMRAGQTRLARYLGKYLSSPENRALLDEWIKLRSNPSRLGMLAHTDANPEYRDYVLVSLFKRAARKNPTRAAQLWRKLETKLKLSPKGRDEVIGQLSVAFAHKLDHASAYKWSTVVPRERRSDVVQRWHIFSAIRLGLWSHALAELDHAPTNELEPAWSYWRARALDAVGQPQDAQALLKSLARTRNYYGFLAADQLQYPYQWHHQAVDATQEELTRIADQPGLRRIREFLKLRRNADARREWFFYVESVTDHERAQAAKLVEDWAWHGPAIVTLARTQYQDDLGLRFPLPTTLEPVVSAHARRYKVEPAWIYAIIRQESAFIDDARSPQGALGLMQLMPRTAKFVAKRSKIHYRGRAQILAPDSNIRLGAGYLASLMERWSHPVLATAAYNAGPTRAERWRPKQDNLPADLWVELVPFAETRGYLKSVFAFTVIYEHRLGAAPRTLQWWMPEVPARAP